MARLRAITCSANALLGKARNALRTDGVRFSIASKPMMRATSSMRSGSIADIETVGRRCDLPSPIRRASTFICRADQRCSDALIGIVGAQQTPDLRAAHPHRCAHGLMLLQSGRCESFRPVHQQCAATTRRRAPPRVLQRRVDPPLEALARIRNQSPASRATRNGARTEEGGFEEDIGGVGADRGSLRRP